MRGGPRPHSGRPKGVRETRPRHKGPDRPAALEPTYEQKKAGLEFAQWILDSYRKPFVERVFLGEDLRLQHEVLRLATERAEGVPRFDAEAPATLQRTDVYAVLEKLKKERLAAQAMAALPPAPAGSGDTIIDTPAVPVAEVDRGWRGPSDCPRCRQQQGACLDHR